MTFWLTSFDAFINDNFFRLRLSIPRLSGTGTIDNGVGDGVGLLEGGWGGGGAGTGRWGMGWGKRANMQQRFSSFISRGLL